MQLRTHPQIDPSLIWFSNIQHLWMFRYVWCSSMLHIHWVLFQNLHLWLRSTSSLDENLSYIVVYQEAWKILNSFRVSYEEVQSNQASNSSKFGFSPCIQRTSAFKLFRDHNNCHCDCVVAIKCLPKHWCIITAITFLAEMWGFFYSKWKSESCRSFR